MSAQYIQDPMLDMYIFETAQLVEQLEQSILSCEQVNCYKQEDINEIFRIMHTIKGSSAMMLFNNITSLAHSIEDIFFYLREKKPGNIDCCTLSDIVLEGSDFIKVELAKIKSGEAADGDSSDLVQKLDGFIENLRKSNSDPSNKNGTGRVFEKIQQYSAISGENDSARYKYSYKAVIHFEEDCEMENMRAYAVIYSLNDIAGCIRHTPEDIDNTEASESIREHGFTVFLKTGMPYDELYEFFKQTVFLKDLELVRLEDGEESEVLNEGGQIILDDNMLSQPHPGNQGEKASDAKDAKYGPVQQSIISVSVDKLDKLMDLVGEMVIAESMVTQNPDLKDLELDNFQKAARQLRKITGELQDMVMSIRMVPLAATFHKMYRIVRDMGKKLNKDVLLEISGEETEVDKNIIERISDPLMHLVRNAIDHGIEDSQTRADKGKPRAGRVILEARNEGSDVVVVVKDDGRGLDKAKILQKAIKNNLIQKQKDELSDNEIYNLIFLPGFSTNESITEYSGRGVGMDVVVRNVEAVGGSISIDSKEGAGTAITLKIPLTLAIIDGMNICVGCSHFTIPTISIKESFKAKESDIISDPDGNTMIMVRGQCYPILCLHDLYKINTNITGFGEGIFIMVEHELKTLCIFADALLGQQQVVVKALPNYIKNIKKIGGLAGCTLLGDGSISLILDVGGLVCIKQ